MEKIAEKSCIGFVDVLASKAPVPGGGGAAALVGAIGMALGSMVCNLTTGKKKYAQYEEDIQAILGKAKTLQDQLLEMIDKVAEGFFPLSQAYGLPANTDEEKAAKEVELERCLKLACEVPFKIVELCNESIKLHEELVDKGSKLAISDVGCGVQALRGAILSAQLNVIINVGLMKDKEYAKALDEKCEALVKEGVEICDVVYNKVIAAMR